MKNYHCAISKQNEDKNFEVNEKPRHENKMFKNIIYNCKPLFKYEISKTKIHKNVSTVKKKKKKRKTSELTNRPVETAGMLATFFKNLFILWKSLIRHRRIVMTWVQKL